MNRRSKIIAALLVTASLIWVEGFLALRTVHPPETASVAL